MEPKQSSKSDLKKSTSTKKKDEKPKGSTIIDDKEGLVQPIEVAELSNAALVWEITKQLGGTVSGDMLNSGTCLFLSEFNDNFLPSHRNFPSCPNE